MKESLVSIFQKINSTNSNSEKEQILRSNVHNEELKNLLYLNLNPYLLFQFSKLPPLITLRPLAEEHYYKHFVDLVKKLQNREVTGNAAKDAVTNLFGSFHNLEHRDLYSKILLKDAIGVGASTVNKVWPGLIPEFKLMLAPNELPQITNVKYPCYIQPKLDGYRCIYKQGTMYSRKGKPFGNDNLPSYFKKLFEVEDYVLDGELYCEGVNFNKLQTILNTYDNTLPNALKFVIYDCVPVKDWEAQSCKKPYSERIRNVREVVAAIADHKKVIDIANDEVPSAKEAIDLYKNHLKKGYEGSMLKAIDGQYKWKRVTIRSGEMLKLKPFITADLKVTDIYEGEGNFDGVAGGVVVDFNGNSVRCGSGFDVATREEMAKSPYNFIGRTAEIKYFEETEDGSLRFPTFIRWRDDK